MNQDGTRDLAWWHIPRWAATMPRIFTTGLLYGLLYGLALGFMLGPVFGFQIALVVCAIRFGLMVVSMLEIMNMGKIMPWRLMSRFKAIVEPQRIKIAPNWRSFVSPQALGRGLVGGLVFGLLTGLVLGLSGKPVFGLAIGLVLGLGGWLAFGLTESDTGEGRPLGPHEIWRNDRVASLVFVFGSESQTGSTTRAWRLLKLAGHVPAVKLSDCK